MTQLQTPAPWDLDTAGRVRLASDIKARGAELCQVCNCITIAVIDDISHVQSQHWIDADARFAGAIDLLAEDVTSGSSVCVHENYFTWNNC